MMLPEMPLPGAEEIEANITMFDLSLWAFFVL